MLMWASTSGGPTGCFAAVFAIVRAIFRGGRKALPAEQSAISGADIDYNLLLQSSTLQTVQRLIQHLLRKTQQSNKNRPPHRLIVVVSLPELASCPEGASVSLLRQDQHVFSALLPHCPAINLIK